MIPRKMQRVSLNLKPVVKNNKVAIPHIVHEEEDSEDDSPDSPLRNQKKIELNIVTTKRRDEEVSVESSMISVDESSELATLRVTPANSALPRSVQPWKEKKKGDLSVEIPGLNAQTPGLKPKSNLLEVFKKAVENEESDMSINDAPVLELKKASSSNKGFSMKSLVPSKVKSFFGI